MSADGGDTKGRPKPGGAGAAGKAGDAPGPKGDKAAAGAAAKADTKAAAKPAEGKAGDRPGPKGDKAATGAGAKADPKAAAKPPDGKTAAEGKSPGAKETPGPDPKANGRDMIGDDARSDTMIRKAVEDAAPATAGQKVVLVVDDKKAVRDIINYTLRNAGYAVLEAEDGWAALKKLAEIPVNAVVLDVMMPKIDGYEVVRRVRQMSDAAKEIPIIMCTAKDTRNDIVNALKAGANDYIVKPFSKDTLLGKVRKYAGDPASTT